MSRVCRAITSARRMAAGWAPPEPPKDVEIYDFDEGAVRNFHLFRRCPIHHLLVEGIHCRPVSWLIERGLQSVPGCSPPRSNLQASAASALDNSKSKTV